MTTDTAPTSRAAVADPAVPSSAPTTEKACQRTSQKVCEWRGAAARTDNRGPPGGQD